MCQHVNVTTGLNLPWGTYCIRACFGAESLPYCNNQFDLMGCDFVAPGDYEKCGFDNCVANADLPVGVYNSSYSFTQGMSATPLVPVTAPASSQCTPVSSPTASGVTYSWANPVATVTAPCFTTTYGSLVASSTPTTTTTGSGLTSSKSAATVSHQRLDFLGPLLALLGVCLGAVLL